MSITKQALIRRQQFDSFLLIKGINEVCVCLYTCIQKQVEKICKCAGAFHTAIQAESALFKPEVAGTKTDLSFSDPFLILNSNHS